MLGLRRLKAMGLEQPVLERGAAGVGRVAGLDPGLRVFQPARQRGRGLRQARRQFRRGAGIGQGTGEYDVHSGIVESIGYADENVI